METKSPRRPSVEFFVSWVWAHENSEQRNMKQDRVSATNAERAISKHRKAIAEEYADKIVILGVVPVDYYSFT